MAECLHSQVGRREGMVLQTSSHDLRVDGGVVRRLTADGSAVLLRNDTPATIDNGLRALLLGHRDLQRWV